MYNKKAVKCYEAGRVLQRKGKLPDAERAYKKAIKINQDLVEAHTNLGNVLLNRGRLKEAFNSHRKALKLVPGHPMLLNNLGNALQLQGENEKAIDWFNKAITRDPNYADAHNNLGNALRGLGSFGEAVASYKRAILINPGLAGAYYNLGSISMELDELDDAAINFRKAIEFDPNHIEAHNGLGTALTDMGEIDKAIASYRQAIEINPENANVYRALSNNKKFVDYDDDIRSMESLYASESISDEQIMHLAFGLGKAYEDIGEYQKSMEFVLQATRLKRASFDYSISESEELFRNIKATFSLEFFSDRKGMGNPDATPIFILGMPRSGTSLVEQILASHPDVFGAGELKDLSNLTNKICAAGSSRKFPAGIADLDSEALEDLGKQYIAGIRNHSPDAKYITDKMPPNFFRIGLIRVILPNARIIHCTRDPMDNCLSLFKCYFSEGHTYSYDMTELGCYYNLYLDLMEYWRNTLPGFIYDQSYERLVADQEYQTRQLLDYCNLPWDDACLDFHKTRRKVGNASNAQFRRPIYKDSVNLWKRYEQQLEPLSTAIYR